MWLWNNFYRLAQDPVYVVNHKARQCNNTNTVHKLASWNYRGRQVR